MHRYWIFYGVRIFDTDLLEIKDTIDKLYIEHVPEYAHHFLESMKRDNKERELYLTKTSELLSFHNFAAFAKANFNYCVPFIDDGSEKLSSSLCFPFCNYTKYGTEDNSTIATIFEEFKRTIEKIPSEFKDAYMECLFHYGISFLDKTWTVSKFPPECHLLIGDFI